MRTDKKNINQRTKIMGKIFSIVCFSMCLFGMTQESMAQCGRAYIAGLMDGSTVASYPKFVQICANDDIADMSIYGIGSANNGGGTDGEEFTFPAVALAMGECLTVADGGNGGRDAFIDYFGCAPDYINPVASINGDDAIELFCSGVLEDLYGDQNVDGTGTPWEYTNGWSVRSNSSSPPNTTFTVGEWTVTMDQSPTMHNYNDNGMVSVDCPPCADFEVTANAFCDDATFPFIEGMYYVSISALTGGFNSGTYEVTIAGSAQTFTGAPIVFGPFAHSVSGNATVTASITEDGNTCTENFEVSETLCTDLDADGAADNDFMFCNCEIVSNGVNPGTIMAQSTPGTFVSGGTSGQVQYYLLVDGTSGTVNVEGGNLTGWFPNLVSGTYFVYAINYDLNNSAAVQAALASSTIDITALANNAAPFDGDCYSACGPAEYDLPCGGSDTSLACNDHLNVTVDPNCEVRLGADAFLEGNNGPDNFYNIEVTTESGQVVDLDHSTLSTSDDVINFIGDDLIFTVVDICSGNTCWGNVTLEDKSVPELDCDEVTVLCTELDNLTPGSVIKGWDRAVGIGSVGAGSNGNIALDMDDVSGTVTNVILNFEASVDQAADLSLCLTSPSGQTTIDLIDHDGFVTPCQNSNYNICLSDDGELSHAMFDSPVQCRATINAFIGSFRPLDAFSGFDGDDAAGVWTLTIKNTGTGTIIVREADLQVTTNEGNLLTTPDILAGNGCLTAPDFDFNDVESGQNCQGDLWTVIQRTWTVTNPNSGQSGSCNQVINVRRFDISDIIQPKNFDGIDQESLSCDDINSDTGSPLLPCSESIESCGNMLISGPTTVEFPLCGNSFKRIYTWTVLDWCSGESAEISQVVKLNDDQPLVISCVPDNISDADAVDYNMNTNAYSGFVDDHGNCTGSWLIIPPLSIDNPCNDETTLAVFYLEDDDDNPNDAPVNGNYILFTDDYQDGDILTGLSAERRTWIRMVVTDECGNTGECFTEVDIEDTANPFCIAVEFITVGMYESAEGLTGKVQAESVDNGSFDNCSALTYEIRRSSNQCNATDSQFGPFVKFCCADLVGDEPYEVLVDLRVTDASGNSCTVSSKVRLQTNFTNVTTCPDGVILDCEDDLDQFYGVPTMTGPCGPVDLNFNLQDVIASTAPASKSASIDPQYDYIGSSAPDNIPAFDAQCGFGAVKRSFFFEGSLICTQYFVIEPANPFNPNLIVFPQDATTNCSAFDFGEPTFPKSSCGKTGISLESDTLFIVDNACYKILNRWSVIDWCEFDQTDGASGIYEDTQIITVIDNTSPTITAEDASFELDDGCTLSGIELFAVAMDNDMCPEDELEWTIEVDEDDNGSVDQTFTRTSFPGDTITVTLSSVGVNKSGHSVTWTVVDDCGNSSSTNNEFTVEDIKRPTPYCLNVSTATMENGQLEIWASDFNAGSFDNCTAQDDLDYSFSETRSEKSLVISETDLDQNGQLQLDIYVWDECGNNDYCVVTVSFSGIGTGAMAFIQGSVTTELGESVQDVETELMSNLAGYPHYNMSAATGEYAFSDNPIFNFYSISGKKNDDYLNGISTLDLVLIQRHILGVEALNSPYKMIAADVNNDSSISAIDLIDLRKLILGIHEEYPNNGSWKFVEADQNLTLLNPWIYNEEIAISELDEDMMNEDFIGVKIGDVNNSMIANVINQATELRSGEGIFLTYEDRFMKKGKVVDVAFAADTEDLYGYQFTLMTEGLEVIQVDGRDLSNENYVIRNEKMAISHNSDYPMHTGNDFMSIKVKVKEAGWLSDMISVSSKITRAEAYVGSDLQIVDVNLRSDKENTFKLFQNEPNPFANQTLIGFELPKAGVVKLSLYDVAGKLIKIIEKDGTKGYNSIVVSKDDIGQGGLIYYSIESGTEKATKHMIMIK